VLLHGGPHPFTGGFSGSKLRFERFLKSFHRADDFELLNEAQVEVSAQSFEFLKGDSARSASARSVRTVFERTASAGTWTEGTAATAEFFVGNQAGYENGGNGQECNV
jgi:hypothetical protein